MLSESQLSNIAQWVSEFPRYSHVINDPTLRWMFAKQPPPADTTEVSQDLWNYLSEELAGLVHE